MGRGRARMYPEPTPQDREIELRTKLPFRLIMNTRYYEAPGIGRREVKIKRILWE